MGSSRVLVLDRTAVPFTSYAGRYMMATVRGVNEETETAEMGTSSQAFWDELYGQVLRDGEVSSPRGRRTLEVVNAMYQARWDEHLDVRAGRKVSLPYIFREFLWFVQGDRYDTRMTKYAPLWLSCVDPIGGINSNYGQYLFGPDPGFDGPLFHALDHIVGDHDSRRAHVAIFQSWHQETQLNGREHFDHDGDFAGLTIEEFEHPEVPCTTGMGFRLKGSELLMNVHMRSQDLWHGAANDEAVCYLIQLVAVAYLNSKGVECWAGPITHYIDSLHFYDRHWEKAEAAVGSEVRQEVVDVINLMGVGFTQADLRILRGVMADGDAPSPLLERMLSIEGDFGMDEFVGPVEA